MVNIHPVIVGTSLIVSDLQPLLHIEHMDLIIEAIVGYGMKS